MSKIMKPMKPQYVPKTLDQKLGYFVEEAGEAQAAIGKAIRWGLESVNPELPPEEQETNRNWILRELEDVERALLFLRDALESTRPEKGLFQHRQHGRRAIDE